MSERRLLFSCVIDECGHLFQLWVDGNVLHLHAECDQCEQLGLEAIERFYPGLPVERVD